MPKKDPTEEARQFFIDLFKKDIGREDFKRYIAESAAGDFLWVLHQHLTKQTVIELPTNCLYDEHGVLVALDPINTLLEPHRIQLKV